MDTASFERSVRQSRKRFSIPSLLLRAAGKDRELRMKMLEFVDVLPSLQKPCDVREYFSMLIAPHRNALPVLLRYGTYIAERRFLERMMSRAMRWLVYEKLAPHFIVTDDEMLTSVIESYEKDGAGVSIDFLGESVTSEREALRFLELYQSAIRTYDLYIRMYGHWGNGGQFHISVKLSALYPFFGPENHAESVRVVSERLASILQCAMEHNVFVTVDAEQYAFRHLVEDVFCDVVSRACFRDYASVGIALQAYRKDALASASRLITVARKRGAPFSIRLVKGAYWDTEAALAEQNGWSFPLFAKKQETDESWEKLFTSLACHWGTVYVSPATHNPKSIAYADSVMRGLGRIPDKHFTFQTLYGLGEPVRKALCRAKLPVLVYTPVGSVEQGMAYFARRILENTSNEGFLFRLLG